MDRAASAAEQISPRAQVCALCMEGKQSSSEAFAEYLSRQSELVFLIGSSHGLSDSLKARASLQLSLSKMTFPHQLTRVLLLEQLYRAQQINHGGKYHK